MTAKFGMLVVGSALLVFIFHHALRAEETTPPAASNVFLDEGDADYEMPKETTPAKAHHAKAAKVADDDDDDKSTAGTKGDAFDQMQNPEAEPKAASKNVTVEKKASKPKKEASENTLKLGTVPVAEKAPKAEPVASEMSSLTTEVGSTRKAEKPTRKVASVSFKQGFRNTKEGGCVMYSDADKTSAQLLVVKGSKKLWVEQDAAGWFKAYHKKGSGYLSSECFE